MNVDPDIVRREIANLLHEYPELNDDVEALDLALSSETTLDETLDELARRYKGAAAFVKALAAEIEETKARKTRFELQGEAAKRIAFALLAAAGVQKRAVPLATFYTSKGQQKVIGDADPETLPERFQRRTIEPNRTEIKKALEAGEVVDGYVLSNAEPVHNIRTK